jgi:uncharacterized protein YfaS (alpha-2-macroglobulin family)
MKTPGSYLSYLTFLSLISLLFLSQSCKETPKEARPLPNGIEDYVSAFTSGVISRESKIRVIFSSNIVGEEEVGTVQENDFFSVSPKVPGILTWINRNSLEFSPNELMESSQTYVITIQLDKFYDNIPPELKTFQFDVKTRDIITRVQIDRLITTSTDNMEDMVIYGHLASSDVFDQGLSSQMLSATLNGKKIPITWRERSYRTYNFSLENIKRKKDPSFVVFTLDQSRFGIEELQHDTIEIPALGDFKVVNTAVVQDKEQYINITFSEPILKNQDLRGLIQITGLQAELTYITEGNQLRVYPSERLQGERELIIEPGIVNAARGKMRKQSRHILRFAAMEPSVRLVGSGNILPNSTGLIFPFEAVGLTAVEVEIFKIYQNNLLQFLQSNDLNGSYELERVGKIIHQEKVALQSLNPKADAAQWTRYALDLSNMFQKDPTAIYQLRIGFRPEYSTYYCQGQDQEDANLKKVNRNSRESGEPVSIFNGWYGINGYYPDYQWEDRNNPCKPAYYNRDRFVSRNLLSSNLAITAKESDDHKVFVAVADILEAQPVSGASITFFNYQQQKIGSGQTDAMGMFMTQLPEKPFAVIASKGEDNGFVKLGDGNALSLSKFEVQGAQKQKGLKGYIYGERGVWRPGDSLFLNFILDDQENTLPEFHPVKYTLKDARGQIKAKGVETNSTAGFYPLHLSTHPDDPTGNWQLAVEVGGANFQKTLKIETVKPNRLKIKLDFGDDYLGDQNGKIEGDLSVNWLHGAPGKNLKVISEVQLRSKNPNFRRYSDYSFNDPTRRFSPPNKVIFEGKTNEKGEVSIQDRLIQNQQPPAIVQARVKTRAFEPGGNFSTDLFTLDYYPYDVFAGLRMPTNKWGQSRLEAGKESSFDIVTVDKKGQAKANRKVSMGIYEISWNWWWGQQHARMAEFNSTNHFNALIRTELQTNAEGKVQWPINLTKEGAYMIRVCDQESKHCTGKKFYVGYPWYADDNDNQARKEASMLTFSAKKEKYEVGETVELEVPSGNIGKILLSLEGGSKVIETRWQEVQEGKNTIRFTATEEMVPTVYAHVSLIQPHSQTINDLPIRMYGVIPIEVENKENILEPVLKMPTSLRPEQTVTLQVSEKNGKDMAYTVAMVDEGLLDLTRFKTPNPYDAFYAKEALGVRTWDMYDEVLGAYGGKLESVMSIGGDGEISPSDAQRNANRFKPVVRHLGPFYLKKGETAKHTITLPNYVGAVRTMVVAGKGAAYGATDKTTPVKKPVMVLATMPRVLGPGETLKLPVTVFAMEDNIKNVKVSISESNGIVDFPGAKSQTLNFTEPDEKMAHFEVKIKKEIGPAKFEIVAEGHGERASQEIEIFVRNPNPPQTKSIVEVVPPGQQITLPIEAVGVKGTNKGYMEVTKFAPLDLAGKFSRIIQYPHGCLEQTTSKAFAQLYVDKAVNLDAISKQQASDHVKVAISKMYNFGNADYGLTYWPGRNRYFNNWATIYATHFLTEARNLGYQVEDGFYNRILDYLERTARLWDPAQMEEGFYSYNNNDLTQAYRLFVLALAGQPDLASMNRLRETKGLTEIARWRLAAAYALLGKKEVANTLATADIPEVPYYREVSNTFGSSTRDQLMILESLIYLGDTKRALLLTQEISREFEKRCYLNTQEIGFLFLAIGKLQEQPSKQAATKFAYTFDSGKLTNVNTKENTTLLDIPMESEKPKAITFRNNTEGSLFINLVLSGRPMSGEEKASNQNLNMRVSFQDMNGRTINHNSIPQGTDFKAVVTVAHNIPNYDFLREMELTQIFPSGWEITNTRFEGMNNTKNYGSINYEAFQDDRVYVYYNLQYKRSLTYTVQLNASYAGEYYLPAFTTEAMYEPSIYASTSGSWVKVNPIQ